VFHREVCASINSVGHNSNFMLELSPDPQGRIPPADTAAYAGFGAALRSCYTGPGAAKAELGGVPVNGMHFDLAGAAGSSVDRVLLAENVAECGQLVTGYELLASPAGAGGRWTSLNVSGQSIGHCRIRERPTKLSALCLLCPATCVCHHTATRSRTSGFRATHTYLPACLPADPVWCVCGGWF
jgi:hypothetical protein